MKYTHNIDHSFNYIYLLVNQNRIYTHIYHLYILYATTLITSLSVVVVVAIL